MASIRDVAKKANVGPTTVSRVLNNSGYVSEMCIRDRDTDCQPQLHQRDAGKAQFRIWPYEEEPDYWDPKDA